MIRFSARVDSEPARRAAFAHVRVAIVSVPTSPSRRRFLQATAGMAVYSLVGRAAEGTEPASEPDAAPDAARGILRLRLETCKLVELRSFYTRVLEFRVLAESDRSMTLRAGGTEITFAAVDTGEPFYHVAFNIPENMLAASKRWLAPRCPIVTRPDGSDEYFFPTWNAHSIYFLDPAGNILEFIARHNLPNARDGEFSARDILHASEIALVVDDVRRTVRAAHDELGLSLFGGTNSEEFAAVGDDHRLLIIVKRGRKWLAGKARPAEVHRLHAAIQNGHGDTLTSTAHRFEVETG